MEKTETMTDLFYETALEAVHIGGKILRDGFDVRKEISYKGAIDLVTNVDIASEKAIITYIKSRHPAHDILTEETHLAQNGSPFRWIIDPLDGTVNYAHNYPFVAVSVAFEINGEIECGAVLDPIHRELFTARKSAGAYLNNKLISVSEISDLGKSFLVTGFPYDIRESENNNLREFNHLAKIAQAVRRDGSAALDLCYTAMGRFDGYWEKKIKAWDIAAGILIVEEAGGKVSDFSGRKLALDKKEIVATNGLIHDELVKELSSITGNNQ